MIKMKMIPNFQNQNLNKRKRERKKKRSVQPLMHCTIYFAVLTSAIVPLEVRQKKNNTTARLSRVHVRKNYNRKNSVSGACALKIVERESLKVPFLSTKSQHTKKLCNPSASRPTKKTPHLSFYKSENSSLQEHISDISAPNSSKEGLIGYIYKLSQIYLNSFIISRLILGLKWLIKDRNFTLIKKK